MLAKIFLPSFFRVSISMDLVGGTLSDDVSSSSIGWWVSVTVVFFLSCSNFACIFFSALQKMVEILLAEVTCCAIY